MRKSRASRHAPLDPKKQASLLSALSCTINHMEQSILILGRGRTVIMANHAAKQQVGLPSPEGAAVKLPPTGDTLNDETEFVLNVDKIVHILGESHIPLQAETAATRYISAFLCPSTNCAGAHALYRCGQNRLKSNKRKNYVKKRMYLLKQS